MRSPSQPTALQKPWTDKKQVTSDRIGLKAIWLAKLVRAGGAHWQQIYRRTFPLRWPLTGRSLLRCGALSLAVWAMPLAVEQNAAIAQTMVAELRFDPGSTVDSQIEKRFEQPFDAIAVNSATTATNNAQTLETLTASSVVYLAETHNSAADHAAQLEIIKGLNAQNKTAIALEMFQRPFQPVLDAYLAGEVSESELIAQSEYETRWGFEWEFYAPILRYAQAYQIPLIALNTPAEITRQVASEGLNSLSGSDFQFIPPLAEIDLSDAEYRALIQDVFDAHGGHGNSSGFENFFAAQVLWDETMAAGVARQLAAEPDRQIIVLAGEAHVGYSYGIPNRVQRRIPEVNQVSVQFLSKDEAAEPDFADVQWQTTEN